MTLTRKRKLPHYIEHDIRVKIKKCKEAKALRRLIALNMYRQGKTNIEIGEATGYNPQRITELVTIVLRSGIGAILQDGRKSNNYRMSYEQETQFLEQFETMAERGELITIQPILEKYEEKTGKSSSSSAIYAILKRHGWRKLQPKRKHPKAASAQEQNRQKKLKLSWQKDVGIM